MVPRNEVIFLPFVYTEKGERERREQERKRKKDRKGLKGR